MTIGRVLYALLFVLALPLLLILWARGAAPHVLLPLPGSIALGGAIAVAGAVLLAAGIAAILLWGGGLPINLHPPPRRVTRGAYAMLRHPIYVGFTTLCFGVALATGSAAGFWLVAPTVAFASAALVLGHERLDLQRRFGVSSDEPWISLPAATERAPRFLRRLAVAVLVFLSWTVIYETTLGLGVSDTRSTYLPFEKSWPVWQWSEAIYASTYLFVLLAPFLAKSGRDLREFALDGLIATGAVGFVFIVVPLAAPPRAFGASGQLGRLLLFERAHDSAANAFPAFHVAWAFIAARAYIRRWRRLRPLWLALATAVAGSCVTTGMHTLADVFAGIATAFVVSRRNDLWRGLRNVMEGVANSWREWRVGPARFINHGVYSAVSGLLYVGGAGILLGPAAVPAVVFVAAGGVILAAVGAQLIEGSTTLLRPFGYFGGLVGTVASSLVAPAVFGTDTWKLLGAFAVVAPWIVVVGRLRCLVQGCCHGSPCSEWLGIRYRSPMSRVCRLSELSGVPLHPTQLYSILWNGIVGLLGLRLWFGGAPLPIVAGVYLIASGVCRFAEEAYRGEPQTPQIGGLRLYQWLAIASVIAGAAVSVAPAAVRQGLPEPSFRALAAAFGFGLVSACAYSLDFPRSRARFSRLT